MKNEKKEKSKFGKKSGFFLNLVKIFMFRPIVTLLYKLSIEGRENIPEKGPAVIVCKHQSWVDLIAVPLITPTVMNYIAKEDLFENAFCDFPGTLLFSIGKLVRPIVAKSLELLGAFPVNRESRRKIVGSFRYARSLMEEKEILVLFPEGRVVKGKMGEFKSGLIELLIKMQDKIGERIAFVPLGISYGTGRALRKPFILKIGYPLYFEADDKEAVSRIKKRVEELTDFNL